MPLMSTLTVLKNPNPELRVVSQPVAVENISTPKMTKLIEDLIETMAVENGVGIAAPQVGVHERVIIVETPTAIRAFINPEITSRSIRLVASMEGCLSVPGISGIVKRHSSVKVKALTPEGKEILVKATGLTSIIFQHEIDHLDGILFIDKATQLNKDVTSRL